VIDPDGNAERDASTPAPKKWKSAAPLGAATLFETPRTGTYVSEV
jgi:hypothetical protein